jgi:hypothetical protein
LAARKQQIRQNACAPLTWAKGHRCDPRADDGRGSGALPESFKHAAEREAQDAEYEYGV